MTKRSLVFPLLVLGLLFITWRLRYITFAWVPAPLFLGSLIVHTKKRPLSWLTGLALVSELFSGLPFGVITVAIFLPWAGRRLARRMETDISFWFFLYILIITGLQILTLGLVSLSQGWKFFPWPMIFISTLATASVVFGLLVIRSFSLPSLLSR